MNGMIGNSMKATSLYCNIACKWNDNQFENFMGILHDVGNLGAHEIFTTDGAEVFLTKDHLGSLKQEMSKVNSHNSGAYEGITLEDERAANTLADCFKNGTFNSDGKFDSIRSLEERRTYVPLIKQFLKGILTGKIWFKNCKPCLPRNYIARRFSKLNDTLSKRKVENELGLIKEATDKLIFIVDGPGMGKSSALTKLEIDLRSMQETSPRLIIRNNLNQTCGSLQQILSEKVTVHSLLTKFGSFIPLEKVKIRNEVQQQRVPVYFLLDGLDEVLPEYKDAMLNILRGLLKSSNTRDELFVVRNVVLTTRPHLRDLIEKEFQVKAVSLTPLDENEQVHYLYRSLKSTNPSLETARNLIKHLHSEVQALLSNPLMLNLYSEIISDDMSAEIIDLYSLFSRFTDRKHEIYLAEKEMVDPALPSTIRRKKNFLNTNLPFYNFVAISELAVEKNRNLIIKQDEIRKLIDKPKQDMLDEIFSYGLVVMEGPKLKFKHRSFAEYFWAKMIVKTSNEGLINSLFGFGYERGNLIATFLTCALPNEAICDVVHKGWTKFVPNGANLARYQDENGLFLVNHILENTITFADECTGKNQLLVADSYKEKLFFRWLDEKVEGDKKKWLEQILFHDSMCEVIAALVFSGDASIEEFVKTWWPPGYGEEQIKKLVRKCPSPVLLIAVKEKYTINYEDKLHTEYLFERMSQWLCCKELIESAQKCLKNNRVKTSYLHHPDISSFVASALSREETLCCISNEEAQIFHVSQFRLEHIHRCWGEEFFPKNLLVFRHKFGTLKGKSLFMSESNNFGNLKGKSLFVSIMPEELPFDLMEKVWSEIAESVDDAAQVIMDDEEFYLVKILENDI